MYPYLDFWYEMFGAEQRCTEFPHGKVTALHYADVMASNCLKEKLELKDPLLSLNWPVWEHFGFPVKCVNRHMDNMKAVCWTCVELCSRSIPPTAPPPPHVAGSTLSLKTCSG